MPSCVVKRCKNNSASQKKCQGITYHKFPTANQPWNNDWIKIIRNCRDEEHWIPSKTSVICSIHFDAHDLYTTKNGLRRVVPYAVPKRLLFELPDMEEQPVESRNTFSLQRAYQLSSHETSIFLPSQSSSLTERSAIVADDFQQPSSPKTSTALSLGLSSSELPLILETVATDSEQPLPSEASVSMRLGLSLSQLSPIGGPSSPYTDTARKRNLKEKLKKKRATIAKNNKRIKLLNQKVRRLQDRNKSLKDILKANY